MCDAGCDIAGEPEFARAEGRGDDHVYVDAREFRRGDGDADLAGDGFADWGDGDGDRGDGVWDGIDGERGDGGYRHAGHLCVDGDVGDGEFAGDDLVDAGGAGGDGDGSVHVGGDTGSD